MNKGDVMRNENAKNMALGGLLAAMAVVVMCLGGMIPVATYVCCVICMVLGQIVLRLCGKRVAWAWYGAVAVLSLLLGTDKEAAGLYLFIGYYPILKPWFEKYKFGFILKVVYFNVATLSLYWCLIRLLGIDQIANEFYEFGKIGLIILLILGNVTFILTDRMLTLLKKKRK